MHRHHQNCSRQNRDVHKDPQHYLWNENEYHRNRPDWSQHYQNQHRGSLAQYQDDDDGGGGSHCDLEDVHGAWCPAGDPPNSCDHDRAEHLR